MEELSEVLRKAFDLAIKGNEEGSLQLLESCLRNKKDEELALLYRIKAELLESMFDRQKDANQLQEAIFYSKKAWNALPKSIESCWYVASLLAKQDIDYIKRRKLVIGQCLEALRIQNPDDPIGYVKGKTPSTRIDCVKFKIHCLLETCLSKKELDIKAFWEGLDDVHKNEFFIIKISQLADFLQDSEAASSILQEALSFYKEHNSFEFWNCYSCGSKFVCCELLRQHYKMEHAPKLLAEHNMVLPTRVSPEWGSHILTGSWKAMNLQQGQSDCSYDAQRESLLQKIRSRLSKMLEHDFLADIHVNYIVEYSMTALKKTTDNSSLIGLDKSHHCICLLSFTDLMGILQFLNCLCEFSVGRLSESRCTGLRDHDAHLQVDSRVSLEGEYLQLLNHEQLPHNNNTNFLDWFSLSASIEDTLDLWYYMQLDLESTWKAADKDTKTNFDTLQKLCEDVRRKLDNTKDLNTIEDVYQACENNGRAMSNAVWTNFEKTFSYEIIGDILLCEAFGIEVHNTLEKGGVELKEAVQRLRYNNEFELMKSCAWLLHAAEERIALMERISSLAVSDYQMFLAPALKCYIQEYLEKVREANALTETGTIKELSSFLLKYRHQKEFSERSADDGLAHELMCVDQLKVGQDHDRKRTRSDSI